YPLVSDSNVQCVGSDLQYIPLIECLKLESRKGLMLAVLSSQRLQGPEQMPLGNILVLFLLGGIFSGVALDWLWLIGTIRSFKGTTRIFALCSGGVEMYKMKMPARTASALIDYCLVLGYDCID
ncbi:unnamed protein product, partial [Thlaspi arvense]